MSVGNTYNVDYYDDIDQFDNKEERRICSDCLDGRRVSLISVKDNNYIPLREEIYPTKEVTEKRAHELNKEK